MRAETYIHGFKIKRVRELPELEGRLWEMTHEKNRSGALMAGSGR